MRKYIIALSATLCCCMLSFANTITVSNNPTSPGQYRRLDSAILAASAGDVLLVSGSVKDYAGAGEIIISKPLVIYGAGYDPRTDQPLATVISNIHLTAAGSGTTISGVNISNQIYADGGTNNITISRCLVPYMGNHGSYTNGINGNNYTLIGNIIGSVTISAYNTNTPLSNIIIQNNIITGSIGGPAVASNIVISNNYFTSKTPLAGAGYAGGLFNANIYNNIFYFKSTAASSDVSMASNCIFNNNIYYNISSANPFNLGAKNNSGSNNINANPAFVSIDLTTTTVMRSDNFNLQAGSPGFGKGTDGTDIGPEGGNTPIQYPYAGLPAIPQLDSMSIFNPVIPPNGTLKVKFTARSNH